jgi:fibronectin-binding autotransporter adhesin
MKSKFSLRYIALASTVLTASLSHAQTSLFWSGNGTTLGGAGTWDTSLARWSNFLSGPYSSAWSNAGNDTAIFGGTTAGSVTLGSPITVGGLQFNTTGYTITTGANSITFGAADKTLLFNNIALATISGNVGGSGQPPFPLPRAAIQCILRLG